MELENIDYKITAIDSVKRLLESTFGDFFRAYFEGDPIDIPQSLLPCLVIEKLNGPVNQTATGLDNNYSNILIKVIFNKKDDFGAQGGDVDLTERKIRHIIEGRDPETGGWLPNTIMYVIRHNITLDGTVVENNSVDVSYDVDFRPGDNITSEGYVTFTVREHVIVNSRS